MKIINTPDAPAAIGPYSQATVFGSLLFTSGQIALDPSSGLPVGDTVKAQAERVMQNLAAILAAGGSDFDHVLKTTCYLADMNDFADFNVVYAAYIKTAPARSCVAVAALPKGALCEVEVIAAVKEA